MSTYNIPYLSSYDANYDPFGTLTLTESSPAQTFEEVITVDDVRDYLRLPESTPDDAREDARIATWITAAREQAEILQGRDLIRKQFDLSFDYWPQYRVELRAPLISVELVQYTDLRGDTHIMQETTDYVVDKRKQPGLITPPLNGSWPSFTPAPSSAILVRFTSGYASDSIFWQDAGARVKAGMWMLISAWYENRLPFEKGAAAAAEYPFAVTSCLSYGGIKRAR